VGGRFKNARAGILRCEHDRLCERSQRADGSGHREGRALAESISLPRTYR
jgi:hypothetical protein